MILASFGKYSRVMLGTKRESSLGGRNWKGGTFFRNSTTASVTTDKDEERVDIAVPDYSDPSKLANEVM